MRWNGKLGRVAVGGWRVETTPDHHVLSELFLNDLDPNAVRVDLCGRNRRRRSVRVENEVRADALPERIRPPGVSRGGARGPSREDYYRAP